METKVTGISNQHQAKKLNALRKRQGFLSNRISRSDKDGLDRSYDKQELAALDWCIDIIERNPVVFADKEVRKLSREIINSSELEVIKATLSKIPNLEWVASDAFRMWYTLRVDGDVEVKSKEFQIHESIDTV